MRLVVQQSLSIRSGIVSDTWVTPVKSNLHLTELANSSSIPFVDGSNQPIVNILVRIALQTSIQILLGLVATNSELMILQNEGLSLTIIKEALELLIIVLICEEEVCLVVVSNEWRIRNSLVNDLIILVIDIIGNPSNRTSRFTTHGTEVAIEYISETIVEILWLPTILSQISLVTIVLLRSNRVNVELISTLIELTRLIPVLSNDVSLEVRITLDGVLRKAQCTRSEDNKDIRILADIAINSIQTYGTNNLCNTCYSEVTDLITISIPSEDRRGVTTDSVLSVVNSTELVVSNSKCMRSINLLEAISTISILSNKILLSIDSRTEGSCSTTRLNLNTISIIECLTVEDLAQALCRVEVFLSLTPVSNDQILSLSTCIPAVIVADNLVSLVSAIVNNNGRTRIILNLLSNADRQISIVNHLLIILVNQLHANNGNTVYNNVSSLGSIVRTAIQTTCLRILRMQIPVTILTLIKSSVCRLVGLVVTQLNRSQFESIFEVTIEVIIVEYIVSTIDISIVSLNQSIQVDILLIVHEIPTFTKMSVIILTRSCQDVSLALVNRLEEVYTTIEIAEIIGATHVQRQVAPTAVVVQHTSLRELIRSSLKIVRNVSNLQVLHGLLNDSCVVRSNNASLILVILISNLSSEHSYTGLCSECVLTIGSNSANLAIYIQRNIQDATIDLPVVIFTSLVATERNNSITKTCTSEGSVIRDNINRRSVIKPSNRRIDVILSICLQRDGNGTSTIIITLVS